MDSRCLLKCLNEFSFDFFNVNDEIG